MTTALDSARKKRARDRRNRQNKKRLANKQLGRVKGWDVVRRVAENERKRRAAPKISVVTPLPHIRSVQPFHNVGKAAVRRDRRIRQERQRIQMKMRAAA